MIRIIAESDVEGERSTAAINFISTCMLTLETDSQGPFDLISVSENLLRCFIKDQRNNDAATVTFK
jgi:hypothetical protein